MADSKEILEISKHLQGILTEVKNAAHSMSKASEKLSTVGVDKLTEELKRSLKQRKLINDKDADAITSGRKMSETLDALEKRYEAVIKIEEEAEKATRKRLKKQGVQDVDAAMKTASAVKAQQGYIKAKLEEAEITAESAKNLKEHIPLIREEADSRAKLIAGSDGLIKAYEGHKASIIESVKEFATLGASVRLAKKAFNSAYDQMNTLSSKGMLGALTQINTMAFSLSTSVKDLEDIMVKNQDVVNQMGGGLEGMKNFGDELGNIRENIKYLGAEAFKSAALLFESSKKAGLEKKNGVAYEKNMTQSTKQMKLFAGAFHDTPEQYTSLIDGMNEESVNREILNNLSDKDIQLQQQEQRVRIQGLKWLGLTNDQILQLNTRVSDMMNPMTPGQIGTRADASFKAETAIQEEIRMLLSSNSQSDQEQGLKIQQMQGVLYKVISLERDGKF